jgi:hypothetical protein
MVNSMLSMDNSANSAASGFSITQRGNMIHTQAAAAQGMQNGFPTQRMRHVTPPLTPPLQPQARSFPPTTSSPPIKMQENPNKRRHSPNL